MLFEVLVSPSSLLVGSDCVGAELVAEEVGFAVDEVAVDVGFGRVEVLAVVGELDVPVDGVVLVGLVDAGAVEVGIVAVLVVEAGLVIVVSGELDTPGDGWSFCSAPQPAMLVAKHQKAQL